MESMYNDDYSMKKDYDKFFHDDYVDFKIIMERIKEKAKKENLNLYEVEQMVLFWNQMFFSFARVGL